MMTFGEIYENFSKICIFQRETSEEVEAAVSAVAAAAAVV